MSNAVGWYPRHRNILNLLDSGELTLLDSSIEDFLYLIADYRTGLAKASAEKIRALCPRGIDLRAIQRSLVRLEELGRIKRFPKPGRRGNYPVLLCHYFVREVSGNWKRVNSANTKSWTEIAYDFVDDPSVLASEVVTRLRTEASHDADGDDTRLGMEASPHKEEEGELEEKEQRSNIDIEADVDIESESSDSREKLPEIPKPIAAAFSGWDKPENGVLQVGPDLLDTLYIDAARLRTDEKCETARRNMQAAWKKVWHTISDGAGLMEFVEECKKQSTKTKMWVDPVFYLRCGQIKRGELTVEASPFGKAASF